MQILIRHSKWNSLIQLSRPFLRIVRKERGVISAGSETQWFQKSSFSTSDKVPTDVDWNGTGYNSLVMQRRWFGRKAGKMGKHLQNLDELAHRQAKERNPQNRSDSEMLSLEESTVTETDDDQAIVSLPLVSDVKARMMKVVLATKESLKAIRGSEPSPELFDSVQVKAYGALAPLNSIGQVVINSPTLATISCFDPDNAPSVRDAIRDMQGMNFNPRIEDGTVVIPIPRVSAETRKATVKQLGKMAENTKQRIRRIRRDYLDVVKKVKDGKIEGISEDDAFRTGKEIDAVTEECIKVLNDVVQKKQDSIMSV